MASLPGFTDFNFTAFSNIFVYFFLVILFNLFAFSNIFGAANFLALSFIITNLLLVANFDRFVSSFPMAFLHTAAFFD
jgi:hypothetical protein